ncbi:MAG: BadF/BadG/BcrA/BcrD ATPase family protein [Rubrobacteraceae bacterium]
MVSYLCVDGGQTKTAVTLLEEDGTEIHAWRASPLTTPWKSGAMDNLRGVVRSIAQELNHRLEAAAQDAPEAACYSLTGYLEGDDRIPSLIREEMDKSVPGLGGIHTIPDYVGNWAAATGGEPGVMVISGGGAVAYGRNASGDSLRVGGWGHVLGDEGSGYWIGLEAIKSALKSRAGMIPKTTLETHVMEVFETEDDRRILAEVYSGSFSEADVAALVPAVVSLADEGDEAAIEILDEAARNISRLCSTALDRLGMMPVYTSGGVFKAHGMVERLRKCLSDAGYSLEVRPKSVEPSVGIFLIARGGIVG